MTSMTHSSPLRESAASSGMQSLGGLLQSGVELHDQEVHVVFVFGLEGLCDDPSGVPVLHAPERHAVHLQNHLTYP